MKNAKKKVSTIGTLRTFFKTGTWSETIMAVVDSSFDHPLQLEEKATMPLAGGIMSQGYQCGMLWGAALAAGAEAYRLYGPGPQAKTEAIIAAQRIVKSFTVKHNNINCLEITEINLKSKLGILKLFVKGGPVKCTRMICGYAPIAFSEINTAYSDKQTEMPSTPVSCTAVLAQKIGLSDMHTVMAAGFAGGIGLSGGGCGALGAAIWILGMNLRKEGLGNKAINSKISDLIDKFIKNANYELECSEIVGRKFENIDDHANYLRDGGCSKIIEVLAASVSAFDEGNTIGNWNTGVLVNDDLKSKQGYIALQDDFGFGQDAPAVVVVDGQTDSAAVQAGIANLENIVEIDNAFADFWVETYPELTCPPKTDPCMMLDLD